MAADDWEHLSVDDMQKWLEQEKADLAKATELRIKEATAFVNAYSAGEISPKEAERRFQDYGQRWSEALPGTHTFKGATDAELLAAIDETRRPDFPERLEARYKQFFRDRKPESSEPSR